LIAFYLLLSVIILLLQNNELFKFLLVSKELKELRRFGIQIRDRGILELMSQIDILCFDKTGVLTTRQMSVKNVLHAGGILDEKKTSASQHNIFHWIKIACALCHDVLIFEKLDLANPVDKALILFAQENGVDITELLGRYKRIYDKPFDPENRYMANGYELDGKGYYFAKGDPQVILKMCNRYMTATGARKKLDFAFLDMNLSNMQAINQSGDTVIAIACSSGTPGNTPANYTFLGLLQLHNPLQSGASETVKDVTTKGIRTMLLTGDRAETAVRVAEKCGITNDSTSFLTGRMIDRIGLREVARQSSYCSIFARLTPSQKGLLIRALQQKGHCIGMVGDGANDGIALHVADVGISFVKNSSPIARKFSDILIKELADILRLIDSAEKINKRIKYLWLFRIFILIAVFVSIYGWVFTT
jgi:Ca2+-transporting ATPase